MPYRVDCECGGFVRVEETAAGATVLCSCGQAVVIPSLRELRRQAGVAQPEVSPALEVEMLLLAGKLPQQDHCAVCGTATDAAICCRTECEKAEVLSHRPSRWAYLLWFLTFGWIATIGMSIASAMERGTTEVGTDRIFPLPLKVCDTCRLELTDSARLKDALCSVPLYQRLLEKYPNAVVSVVPPRV